MAKQYLSGSLHICHSVIYPYPLECIGAPSYSVEIDIYVKCLHTYQFLSEMFSISQGIDKVTHIFQFVFVSTFIIVHFWIVSPPWFHDINLVLFNEFLQYSKRFCIVETINLGIWHQAVWYIDLPWPPIDIITASIKGSKWRWFPPFSMGRGCILMLVLLLYISQNSPDLFLFVSIYFSINLASIYI